MRPRSQLLLLAQHNKPSQYVCPSCLFASRTGETRPYSNRTQSPKSTSRALQQDTRRHKSRDGLNTSALGRSARRNASSGSLASSTAINPPLQVAQASKALHQKLSKLRESAAGFVDLSSLELAVRSLEVANPVIRVALLGLDAAGGQAVRKLARLLVCDPLSPEATWEKELLDSAHTGQSVLLRYGDAEDIAAPNPLLRTIPVPSSFLQRHNLEIMITNFNSGSSASASNPQELQDAVLVPPLTIPNSAGRVGFVRNPVHKALIVAEGVGGAILCGRLPLPSASNKIISFAIDTSLRSEDESSSQEHNPPSGLEVDVELATHALKLFRSNQANGAIFSNEWLTSRIAAASEWIAASTDHSANTVTPAVVDYTSLVLDRTERLISLEETDQINNRTESAFPEGKRGELESAVSAWSADAHRDLRLNLAAGLESPSWRRTAWFRLLWRIDDVSFSAGDILRQNWLNEAEQSLAFLSGRMRESGVATADDLKENGIEQKLVGRGMKEAMERYESGEERKESVAELLQIPTMLSRVQQESGLNPLFDPPWPQTISLARQLMLHTVVPAMHRKAQGFVLSTATTISATSALAGWLWVATSGVAAYEAGAIAALGLVWSLRRLQRLWGKEREAFSTTAREDGRRILGEIEHHLRKVVQDGGREPAKSEDADTRHEARRAVQECRDELSKLS